MKSSLQTVISLLVLVLQPFACFATKTADETKSAEAQLKPVLEQVSNETESLRSDKCAHPHNCDSNSSDPDRPRYYGHRFHHAAIPVAEAKDSKDTAKEGKDKGNSGTDAEKRKDADKKAAENTKAPDDKPWDELLVSSKKLYQAGKLSEAAGDLDLALAAAERLKSDGARADAFQKLGEHYLYLHEYERAKALMEEGLKLKRKIPGFKSISNANALDNLAQAYARTGNLESASKFEHEALSTYESLKKTETHDYAIALSNHANTLRQLKQFKEAEQYFAKAVATQQKIEKEDSIELAKILLNAGGMYCETNKLDSAKRLLDRASKIIRAKLNREHPLYRLSVKSERVLYKKRVDFLLKKDPNPVRPEVAQAVLHLAALYDAEGDTAQSAAAYKQGLSIEEQLLPADSPELKKVRDEYTAISKKLNN